MSELLTQPIVYWQAGGLLMIPLAAVCLALWTLFFRMRRDIADALAVPADCGAVIENAVRQGDPLTLSERLPRFPVTLRAAVQAAVQAYAKGRPPGEAFEKRADADRRRLGRHLTVLNALTAMAPLLGLLGTVVGMIATFRAVSDTAGDTSAQVASGISQALITTQFGLAIAIPGVWGAARLRRALRQVQVTFARCQAHLALALRQSAHTRSFRELA